MKHGNFKKGEYEKAVELAKEMLSKGQGIGEIKNTTHLSEEDVRKIQRKAYERKHDKNTESYLENYSGKGVGMGEITGDINFFSEDDNKNLYK